MTNNKNNIKIVDLFTLFLIKFFTFGILIGFHLNRQQKHFQIMDYDSYCLFQFVIINVKQRFHIFYQQNINFPITKKYRFQILQVQYQNMIKSQIKNRFSPISISKSPIKQSSVDPNIKADNEKQNKSSQHRKDTQNNKNVTPTKIYNRQYRMRANDQNSKLNKTADGRINLNIIDKFNQKQQNSHMFNNLRERDGKSQQRYSYLQQNDQTEQRMKMHSTMMSKLKQMGDVVSVISNKYNYNPTKSRHSYISHFTQNDDYRQQNKVKNDIKLNIINSKLKYSEQNKNAIKSTKQTLYEITNRQVQSKIITQQSQHLQQSHYQSSGNEGQSNRLNNLGEIKYKLKQSLIKLNKCIEDSNSNNNNMTDFVYADQLQDYRDKDKDKDSRCNNQSRSSNVRKIRDRSSSRYKIKQKQVQHKLQARNIQTMHMKLHQLLSQIKADQSITKYYQKQDIDISKKDANAKSKTSRVNIKQYIKQCDNPNYFHISPIKNTNTKQIKRQLMVPTNSDCDKQIHADLIKKYMQKTQTKQMKNIQNRYKYYQNSKQKQNNSSNKYHYNTKMLQSSKIDKIRQQYFKKQYENKFKYLKNSNTNMAKQIKNEQIKQIQPQQSIVKQINQGQSLYQNSEYVDLINNQITKIKERIQNSQKVTKDMQSKYLYTPKYNINSQTNNKQNQLVVSRVQNLNKTVNCQKQSNFKLDFNKFGKQQSGQSMNRMLNTQRYKNRNQGNSYYKNYMNKQQQSIELKLANQTTDEYMNKKWIQPYNCDIKMPINQTKYIKHQIKNNGTKTYGNNNEVCCKLACLLAQQIQIDQKLRQYRQLFHHLQITDSGKQSARSQKNKKKTQQKWTILRKKLAQLKFVYTQQQLQQKIQISTGQTDPFHSHRPQPTCNNQIIINKLAQLFIKSQQFWANCIINCLNSQQVNQSGFQIQIMDLCRKDYICIEDIVCFINLYTGKHYRNRDTIALFNRFKYGDRNKTKENKISYQTIQAIIIKSI